MMMSARGLPTTEQDDGTPFSSRCVKDVIEEQLLAPRRDTIGPVTVRGEKPLNDQGIHIVLAHQRAPEPRYGAELEGGSAPHLKFSDKHVRVEAAPGAVGLSPWVANASCSKRKPQLGWRPGWGLGGAALARGFVPPRETYPRSKQREEKAAPDLRRR